MKNKYLLAIGFAAFLGGTAAFAQRDTRTAPPVNATTDQMIAFWAQKAYDYGIDPTLYIWANLNDSPSYIYGLDQSGRGIPSDYVDPAPVAPVTFPENTPIWVDTVDGSYSWSWSFAPDEPDYSGAWQGDTSGRGVPDDYIDFYWTDPYTPDWGSMGNGFSTSWL